MDFAGRELIYLSKLKKAKIKKLKKSEEDNKEDAPQPLFQEKIQLNNLSKNSNKQYKEIDSEDSDDAYLSVYSNDFNIDLENPQKNNQINFNAAPGIKYKKAIDTNVCVIRYKTLESKPEQIVIQLYQCKKCQSYLNKYSELIPTEEKDKYNWKCEFCFNENKNIYINKENLPKTECFEKSLNEPLIIKHENKEEDDTSLIFCLDRSGSMSKSYSLSDELRAKFNEIRGDKIGSSITRLDMVKISVEKIIKSLLKESTKVKAGLVTFGSNIEVKGDCLSNVIMVDEKKLDKEAFLQSLGKENTNLMKTQIDISFKNIINAIREIKAGENTAMGPAIYLSLYLLNNAKPGSRIFLCTDGKSNRGIGNVFKKREIVIQFIQK